MTIKFNLYHVTDGARKAPVSYSYGENVRGELILTIYERGYEGMLAEIFGDDSVYENDSDLSSDYFDKGRARLSAGHPHFEAALAAYHRQQEKREAARAKKRAARAR